MRGGQPGVVGRLEHRRAEAARQAALLDRQDEAALLDRLADRLAVERLDEPGVDHADPQAVEVSQPLGHPQAGPDHRPAGQEHAVGLPLEDLGLAQLHRLDVALDDVEVRAG